MSAYQRFRSLFGRAGRNGTPSGPVVDIPAQIEVIKLIETGHSIPTGQRIHRFNYANLELRLDRDVTGNYRVTANEGTEKRYSFSIKCEQGDYPTLQRGLEEVAAFLAGERGIRNLPDHDLVKGYFYGN